MSPPPPVIEVLVCYKYIPDPPMCPGPGALISDEVTVTAVGNEGNPVHIRFIVMREGAETREGNPLGPSKFCPSIGKK